MTREEIIKLLAILSDNYNIKITNPAGKATAWEITLGPYSAESIFKAARLHMETNKYFPSPADLIEKITRSEVVYGDNSPIAINAPKVKTSMIPENMTEEEYLDHIWQDMVELENELYPDEQPQVSNILGNCLPYEK